jgi:cytochrome c
MEKSMKHPVLSLMFALACATPALATETFEKVKVEAGQALFDAECHRCHAVDTKHESYGPPLENILYRGAGTYPDYDYSIALAASGIVWTPVALRAWMEDNKGFMPGTKMRHVGIEDRTVQDFILAYLTAISPQDNRKASE